MGDSKRDQVTETLFGGREHTWCFTFNFYPNILQMQE